MKKILILCADSNGGYPIPATLGGAVSILVECLADGNELKKMCDLTIVSFFEPKAFELAKKYKNTSFFWIKPPKLVKLLDKGLFGFVKKFKRNEKAISFRSFFSLLFYIHKAKKIVKKTKNDNVVIENNIPLALVFKRKMQKINVFYHLHNVPRIDAKCRDVMEKVQKFICVSQFVADSICSKDSAIGQIPIQKTCVLFNCVDTSLFKPLGNDYRLIQLKEKLHICSKDKILIFVGRLTNEKGANIVLRALKQLPIEFKLLVVGSFHYNVDAPSRFQDELKILAKELSNRVIFTGYVQHNDLPLYYNLADFAVLPSLWDEPAGLTNLEAMACGVPIITTNSGGIPEYVGNSVILDRGCNLVDNIVCSILELCRNPVLYECKRQEGVAFVRNHFDKNAYIVKFLNALDR